MKSNERSGRSRPTIRGWAEPSSGEVILSSDPPASSPPEAGTSSEVPSFPATRDYPEVRKGDVEIEWVHEKGTPALLDGPWRTYEVWTQNNIYGLNGALTCVMVIDRATGQPDRDHKILGSHLMGGKLRGASGVEISHPLPRLGAHAVFEQSIGKRVSFSETSGVTRVVLRLRLLKIGADAPPPGEWRRITGSYRLHDE